MTMTPELRRANLVKAQAAHVRGAEVRREIAAGTLALVTALADSRSRGMTVERLLCALPRVGKPTATDILKRAHVRSLTRVRELTPGQKERLCRAAADRGYRYEVPW